MKHVDHTREAAIRARAYQLWIEGGYADGQQDANWRQAEREIAERERTAQAAPPVAHQTISSPPLRLAATNLPHSDGTSFHPSVLDPGLGRAAA